MVEIILSGPFFRELVLPFLLVFAIVFAVLQKSQILGKDKKQIDAIVALVLGLIVVAIGSATNIITGIIPVLAVGLVILLAFFLLWGFAFHGEEFKTPLAVKGIIGIGAAIAVIITTLVLTGAWDYIKNLANGGGSSVMTNIIFGILIIIAIVAVIGGFGGKSGEKKD